MQYKNANYKMHFVMQIVTTDENLRIQNAFCNAICILCQVQNVVSDLQNDKTRKCKSTRKYKMQFAQKKHFAIDFVKNIQTAQFCIL